MDYAFDPELAAIVPFLPTNELGDPEEARRGLAELIAGFAADVPTAGLTFEDLVIPGHESGPGVPVRV